MHDEPRFLSRASVPSYTLSRARAMPREPEALSEDDQQRLSDHAHRTAEDAQRAELERLLSDARREYEHLAALTGHAEKQVRRLEKRFRNR